MKYHPSSHNDNNKKKNTVGEFLPPTQCGFFFLLSVVLIFSKYANGLYNTRGFRATKSARYVIVIKPCLTIIRYRFWSARILHKIIVLVNRWRQEKIIRNIVVRTAGMASRAHRPLWTDYASWVFESRQEEIEKSRVDADGTICIIYIFRSNEHCESSNTTECFCYNNIKIRYVARPKSYNVVIVIVITVLTFIIDWSVTICSWHVGRTSHSSIRWCLYTFIFK